MPQLNYNMKPARGFKGMKADARFDHVEGSLLAAEAIEIGKGVVRKIAVSASGLPAYNQGNIVFDADLITGNTIDLKINGTSISQVTYATSHANTMALIIAQIILNADVLTAALDPADTDSRTIRVTFVDGANINITEITVAAGASQADGVYFKGDTDNVYGLDDLVRLPAFNQGSLVFDADLVTSNTIDMDVNGTAMSQVTFATSHLNTMGLIITALEAMDDVQSAALDATDTNNRTIIITGVDDTDIAVTSIVVAAGASQANGAYTKGTRDVLYGIALHSFSLIADSDGVVSYAINDPVNILRQGAVYVYSETAVLSSDTVYCRHEVGGNGDLVGQFRNDSDSGKCFAVTGAKFKESTTAPGIVKVEINFP